MPRADSFPRLAALSEKRALGENHKGKAGVRRNGSQTSSNHSICLCFSLGFGKPFSSCAKILFGQEWKKKERKKVNQPNERSRADP